MSVLSPLPRPSRRATPKAGAAAMAAAVLLATAPAAVGPAAGPPVTVSGALTPAAALPVTVSGALAPAAALPVAVSGALAPAAGPPVTVSGALALQRPSFRAGVDLVLATVTVIDAEGRFLTGLDRSDFTVYEDGARQQVEFFGRSELPIALSLLLDTSGSMQDKLATAQEAAVGFARRLRPKDLGELIDFDSRVHVAQSFTSDVGQLERAIRGTTAGGSTSLYNAIYISLKELRRVSPKSESDVRRQAIVVLSDGEDTSSLVTYDEVLELAKRSETAIYTIGLRSRDEGSSRGQKEAEFVLRDLARQTGGRAFFPARVEELSGVYAQIAEELASQYQLGYVSTNQARSGAWRRLTVLVDRPGARTRTRLGYYGPR